MNDGILLLKEQPENCGDWPKNGIACGCLRIQ